MEQIKYVIHNSMGRKMYKIEKKLLGTNVLLFNNIRMDISREVNLVWENLGELVMK